MKKTNLWLPLWIALGIAAGIFIGYIFAPMLLRTTKPKSQLLGEENKIDEIFHYIDKAYVDTVNVDGLIERAIPTILSGLDPHSSYITAEEIQRSGDMLNGHFSGIGVEFIIYEDTVAVIRIIPNGPSEAVGILPGDRIVTVNDSLFAGTKLTNQRVLKTLRGVTGSTVKLGLKRDGQEFSVNVTRADVPVESVNAAYKLADNVAYIKISQFGSTTYNEFINAAAELKMQGCKAFIIDLQQNGGGYLDAPRQLANEFLSADELIYYTEGRAYKRKDVYADGRGTCKGDQLVVLLDEASASASEVFSGAMQDNDRALIVGRRSFGKGLVQQPFRFKDGSEMRLTIARYHTPSGRCVQKNYEIGNNDAYNQDLINRFMRGEFDSQDSIKIDNLPLFHTVYGNRPVYGDEGIMPDVFVPRDTTGQNSYYIKIVNSGVLREFTFIYCEKNREKMKTFKTWQEAAGFLATQPLAAELADYAHEKGIYRRPKLIAESKVLLQTQIEALILRNTYGEKAFYPVFQRDDVLINKALNLIKEGKATTESIRNSSYK
ncbi:S41 family peptidase [Dysgonomonas sp. 25]|uniref:S41 family peptidase n=1 Tax=Dysgonomonas sp. 25 TaxID=2302933 RepID=UPI0013D68102|nr:S41 family peptidase [Dysgonomonas sp. 25]NDV68175.1 S41 family peptidase [Dysgonomonas sp. 25]